MNYLMSLLLISLAACTAIEQDTSLTLDLREVDRISGTYEADGIAIAFEFSRGEGRHVTAFHAADGRPLIIATLEGAFQTTAVLGGRLVVSGIANAPNPTIEGDLAALEELNSLPEAGLRAGLHAALASAGIDADLYEPKPPPVSSITNYDNYYFLFGPGETNVWYSSGWATRVQVENRWPTAGACAIVRLEPSGAAATQYLSVMPHTTAIRYPGWFLLFNVRNLSVPYYGCQPAPVLVRVDP